MLLGWFTREDKEFVRMDAPEPWTRETDLTDKEVEMCMD